jgi:hypothetical protein
MFVLLATLINASMVVVRFLTKLSTGSFRIVNEFKRRTEMRYPGWKVYIDATFIGAGLVAPLLMFLLQYRGWKTSVNTLHDLTVYADTPYRGGGEGTLFKP